MWGLEKCNATIGSSKKVISCLAFKLGRCIYVINAAICEKSGVRSQGMF